MIIKTIDDYLCTLFHEKNSQQHVWRIHVHTNMHVYSTYLILFLELLIFGSWG